jgi:hypothetical protein
MNANARMHIERRVPAGTTHLRDYSVDEILANSWDKKLAKDLAGEIEACTGDKRDTIEEMRRFLAVKGYRELLERLKAARAGKAGDEALDAVAHALRGYALDRPALSAAAFRSAAADCPAWREAHEELHSFMMDTFATAAWSNKGLKRH